MEGSTNTAFREAKAAGLPKKENSEVGTEVNTPPMAMDLAVFGVREEYATSSA